MRYITDKQGEEMKSADEISIHHKDDIFKIVSNDDGSITIEKESDYNSSIMVLPVSQNQISIL